MIDYFNWRTTEEGQQMTDSGLTSYECSHLEKQHNAQLLEWINALSELDQVTINENIISDLPPPETRFNIVDKLKTKIKETEERERKDKPSTIDYFKDKIKKIKEKEEGNGKQSPKNNLDQEELLFKEQIKTKVPDEIEKTLDAFLYATEFKSDEAVLRKFAFGYVMSTIVILGFFHQMGSGWFSFDIGSFLNFMGIILKQLVNGVCFNALAVASVLTISFDKKDLSLLLENKEKIVYSLTFFIGIVLAMFGSEFTWTGLFLWLSGAAFGAGLGLNFGIKFINEKLK